MSDYTLEIISHHEKFNNRPLRKYDVEGIETVGAWGDEPFEIRFKNNSWKKVQVRLSVDGTDILTGSPATTEINKDMWVVNAYATLSLKAWPESNNGGASFVFTSATNSVALHTHGDMSSRGIIASAVFEEGYIEPKNICRSRLTDNDRLDYFGGSRGFEKTKQNLGYNTKGGSIGGTYGSNSIGQISEAAPAGAMDYMNLDCERSLESLVSVGAGQHVSQKIVYVTGLKEPKLAEIVRVKYLWWDDLQSNLKDANYMDPHPSGFPGDKNHDHIDLKNVPKVHGKRATAPIQRHTDCFTRF